MNKKPTVLGVFLILLMTIISPTTSISKQSSNTISLNDNGWEEEDNTPPNLTIIFPELGLYLFNQKIMNLSKSIIAVGPVDIIAEASDDESGIDYVEYELVRFPTFIMGVFQGESYIYRLSTLSFGRWYVTITAYDNAGNMAVDKIEIWKFL